MRNQLGDDKLFIFRKSVNDPKRDLTVVKIVYRKSMMAASLLDLFQNGGKRPH